MDIEKELKKLGFKPATRVLDIDDFRIFLESSKPEKILKYKFILDTHHGNLYEQKKDVKSLRQLAKEKTEYLDKEWEKKYPNGKFTIQETDTAMGICWNRKRSTSWTTYQGLSMEYIKRYDSIMVSDFQECWGKVKHFDNLEDALNYARKKNFPEKLIYVFKEAYNLKRKEET